MSEQSDSNKRRHLRFPPGEQPVALLRFAADVVSESQFKADATALVIEESRGGCRLALGRWALPEEVAEGTRCTVRIGRLGLQLAEIRWLTEVDEDIAKLGLQYIDN